MSDPRLFLVDILERARRIARYVSEGREAFEESELLQHGILRNLEVIGEAAKRIDAEARQRWSDVPWKRMAGLRDILIHAYRDVDSMRSGPFCTEDVPAVVGRLEEILRELGVDPDARP